MTHFGKGVMAGVAAAVIVAVLLASSITQFVPPPGGVAGQFLATDGLTPATYSWGSAAQPPAQDNSNHLVSGGSVAWIPGTLQYVVQAAVYVINGVQYTSPQTTLTLVADGGADRIDTIILNTSGVATFLAGAPSGTPVAPVADPSTELELTFAYIAAGAGVPSNVSSVLIYDEDAGGPTEWTTTVSGAGMAAASVTNPYHLTKDVEATAATSGQYVQFVAAAPFNPLTYNTLVFYIRAKTGWGNNRQLQFQWMNGGATTGTIVAIRNGAFGFSTSNTASYQQIVIPIWQFGSQAALGTVDRLRITVAGSGGTVGFYLDYVQLQAGVAPTAGPYMTWRGSWSSAVGYAINDTVISANGLPYIATAANTNSAPPSANWTALVAPPYTVHTCMIVIGADNAAAALVDADVAPQTRQCDISTVSTVTEVEVSADGGTPQVQVAKNHGGALTSLLSAELPTDAAGAPQCATVNATCYGGQAAKSGGVSVVTAGSANVLSAGDYLQTRTATAGGTAKRMSIAIKYTVP